MRYSCVLVLAAVLGGVAAVAGAQSGLSAERAGGLGLKPARVAPVFPSDLGFGSQAALLWRSSRPSDYALYGGTREAPRPGPQAAEAYGGVVYSMPRGWGTSLEAGYAQETPFAPQRYSVSGQLHTAIAGRGVSIGLKYRAYAPDFAARGALPESVPPNGYTLAPPRHSGLLFGPSYQLQMSYQYSTAGAVGLALGREVETFTPFLDYSSSGPRQLSFTGQHWLTPSWALSYDLLSHDAGQPLKLQGLRLGVRYRF